MKISNHKQITPKVQLNLQTIDTARGKVQYDMYGAEGPVILSIHGGFGGADQGRLFASWLQDKKVRIISPSRPGYLDTPLSSGATYEEQADLMVALLNALDISKATVVTYSAGGPVAYALAERHPDRIQALVSIDSTSLYTPTDLSTGSFIRSGLGQRITKLSAQWFTSSFITQTLVEVSTLSRAERKKLTEFIMNSPERVAFFKATIDTLFPYTERELGNDNDQYQLRRLKRAPLKNIRVPTLVMHDAADGDVPFYNGVYAYESIPHAERYWMQGGGHLGFWLSPNSKEAQSIAWSFIAQHSTVQD